MGVRGTEMGRRPIAKSVEFSMVPGREGHHLLGQILRKVFPLFAALFGFGPLCMRVCVGMCFGNAHTHAPSPPVHALLAG